MSFLQTLVNDPTQIFDKEKEPAFNGLVKELGDLIVGYSKLDEVYVDGLDASQIYGQVKIVVDSVGGIVMGKLDELEKEKEEEEESVNKSIDDEEVDDELDVEDKYSDSEDESINEDVDKETVEVDENVEVEENVDQDSDYQSDDSKDKASEGEEETTEIKALNDGFFDINQFNKQILDMENAYADEAIDLNKEISDEEVDYFQDFFEDPKPQRARSVKLLDDSSPEDSDQEVNEGESDEDEKFNAINEVKKDLYESTFEKQQSQLQKDIAQLENELVAEKKWMMKGEVTKTQRPEDSLLTEDNNFDFDRVSKPVPIITEQVTETLEDLIRQRISKDEFDDLPKRFLNELVKPERTRTEVSETKSSKSLAEIYEDSYNKVDVDEKQEKLNNEHEEILGLIGKLNYKLDALTSFNFIPKPKETKLVEVTNSTITMEDAQPEYIGDAQRLAPQEIFTPGKSDLEIQLKSGLSFAKQELSKDERQRLRRANKRKKSKQMKARPEKKSKTGEMIDALKANKNLTIIGKHGEKMDVSGKAKKEKKVVANNLML